MVGSCRAPRSSLTPSLRPASWRSAAPPRRCSPTPGCPKTPRTARPCVAFVHLLFEQLVVAGPAEVLDLVLRYHRQVQRARSSGSGWISEQGDDLRADLTNYTGYRQAAPFPAYKLNILANLLRTTGRLPTFVAPRAEPEEVERVSRRSPARSPSVALEQIGDEARCLAAVFCRAIRT